MIIHKKKIIKFFFPSFDKIKYLFSEEKFCWRRYLQICYKFVFYQNLFCSLVRTASRGPSKSARSCSSLMKKTLQDLQGPLTSLVGKVGRYPRKSIRYSAMFTRCEIICNSQEKQFFFIPKIYNIYNILF